MKKTNVSKIQTNNYNRILFLNCSSGVLSITLLTDKLQDIFFYDFTIKTHNTSMSTFFPLYIRIYFSDSSIFILAL